MHLNADIIFEGLADKFSVKMFGPRSIDLALNRPRFLTASIDKLAGNGLYVVEGSDLTPRSNVRPGACLVCLGDNPQLGYYKEHCCVIQINNDSPVADVFNAIQALFDRFDEWEDDLSLMADGDAHIQSMIERSYEFFCNPLFAIDSDFSLMGSAGFHNNDQTFPLSESFDGIYLQPTAFSKFSEKRELLMYEDEPFFVTILDQSTLNKNLLHNGEYLGCLTLCYVDRGSRASDKPLLSFLGDYLEKAYELLQDRPGNTFKGSLRRALAKLVNDDSLEPTEELAITSSEANSFLCALLRPSQRLDQLPLGYICKTVEGTLTQSVAFEYDTVSIVAFINLTALGINRSEIRETAHGLLAPFVRSLELSIGLSDPIDDLTHASVYLKQARLAIDIGKVVDPTASLYDFQTYALDAMLINATAGLPLKYMMSPGFRRLLDHDGHSDTSYVETLRVLLKENMNITKTASELYVHRSTLLERLTRIRRELGGELDTPEGCLRLRMLIAAMDAQERLQGNLG